MGCSSASPASGLHHENVLSDLMLLAGYGLQLSILTLISITSIDRDHFPYLRLTQINGNVGTG